MSKPHPSVLLLAVFVTVAFSFIAFLIALSFAENAYAQTHQLAVYREKFLWMDVLRKQEVTIGMLSTDALLFTVLLPTILYGLLHPVVGRVLAALSHALANQLDSVLGLKAEIGEWQANSLLMFGALWPITMLFIPMQIIALLFCHIYRSLWS
jgi:hypothetical protein